MKLNLRAKIVLITVAILFLAIGLNTAISSHIFTNEYSASLQRESLIIAQGLNLQLSRILNLGIRLNDIVGFDNQCKETADRYEEISFAMVVDENGKIIFHSDSSQQEKKIDQNEILDAIKSRKEQTYLTLVEGSRYYEALAPVYGSNGEFIGAVIVGFPEELITNKTASFVTLSLSVAIVSFILGIIFLFLGISNWIIKPLLKLLNVIKEIREKGDLTKKAEINSNDELGELAIAFNQMTADLKKSRGEIESYSKNLEKQVWERTNELGMKVKEAEESRTATLNVLEDVEESKRQLAKAQEQLKESLEKLQLMDKKKDEFISIAAHELRTPITTISGFVQLLQNPEVAKDQAKLNNYLNIVRTDIKRLDTLISSVLDLSRLDLGTLKLNPEQVDVLKLFEELHRDFTLRAKEKGLKFILKADRTLPEIYTDKERLRQILSNLVVNAIKFTQKGSVKLAASVRKDKILFYVKDTGMGIPKKEFKNLFHRFYQVDSSATRKAGGSGLGLAISKELAQFLGGRIWLESKLRKGSTFYVELPVKKQEKIQ